MLFSWGFLAGILMLPLTMAPGKLTPHAPILHLLWWVMFRRWPTRYEARLMRGIRPRAAKPAPVATKIGINGPRAYPQPQLHNPLPVVPVRGRESSCYTSHNTLSRYIKGSLWEGLLVVDAFYMAESCQYRLFLEGPGRKAVDVPKEFLERELMNRRYPVGYSANRPEMSVVLR